MKLTEHFTLEEFEYSATAIANGIDNHCPTTLIPNLVNLCNQVLEPLRQHLGTPVIISSGYRCPELNRLIGGAANSQHMTGEAADIILAATVPGSSAAGLSATVPGSSAAGLKESFIWLADTTRFDQLILETNATARWIHVSCRIDDTLNRQHAFTLKK